MADTNQTIQNFYEKAIATDFARDINFRVLSISAGGTTLDQDVLIYAKSGRVPEREINNQEVPYSGLTFNVPGTVSYPDSSGYEIEFYCDETAGVREIFEDLSRQVFDEDTTSGDYSTPARDNVITLVQLDKQLNEIRRYKLIGCYVQKVGQLEYPFAEGTGEVVSFPVTLAYQYFERG